VTSERDGHGDQEEETRKGLLMERERRTNVLEHKRRTEVPEPEVGFAVVRRQSLNLNQTPGGVYIPEAGDQPYERSIVVKTSGGWYAGSTWVEHKAKPGDIVLAKPDAGRISWTRDPKWPMNHYVMALQDLCAHWPCEMAELDS
jgi:hypothetical protein